MKNIYHWLKRLLQRPKRTSKEETEKVLELMEKYKRWAKDKK